MNFVETYINLKKTQKKKEEELYNVGCNKLLNLIHLEYCKFESKLFQDFECQYKRTWKGLLFGLDFNLVNSTTNITLDSEIIKTEYLEYYSFVKNIFLQKIINLDEYVLLQESNRNSYVFYNELKNNFHTREYWATALFKYQYEQLLNENQNLTTELLESFKLFENYNVNFGTSIYFEIFLTNDDFDVKLTDDSICQITNKSTKETYCLEKLPINNLILAKDVYKKIFDFIKCNCQSFRWIN